MFDSVVLWKQPHFLKCMKLNFCQFVVFQFQHLKVNDLSCMAQSINGELENLKTHIVSSGFDFFTHLSDCQIQQTENEILTAIKSPKSEMFS